MNLNSVQSIYFVGAGGIGMSALIRYFIAKGKKVGGYDRTPCELTEELIKEGADIHYEESVERIPGEFRNRENTLIVYTPAVPADHAELVYFRNNGFDIKKRAEVLGLITRDSKALCVAGTHGKTTTSTMTAHLLYQSHVGCTAFLGGIAKNYHSNLLLMKSSPYTVIEADEFDRSFHQLSPFMSVVTAVDPDHLDIYGTEEAYLESFAHYTSLIREGGALIMHSDIKLTPRLRPGVRRYTYGRDAGYFHAENIVIGGGEISFDFVSPEVRIDRVRLGVPVSINIENGVAAMAMAYLNGATAAEIRAAMASFAGVERRFDFKIKTDEVVLLSDYAHHPAELEQSINSMRQLYPKRHITGIFQPHLYSRTRDFYREFAQSLSLLDEVILTDIYPAREEPIPGISSRIIYDNLRPGISKRMCRKEELPALFERHPADVLMVLGAGDVEDYVKPIEEVLLKRLGKR
jgi:UDP-N-acetylmuramate--alanine ligase